MTVVLNTVVPVFVLIAAGFVAARRLGLEARPFARLGVYVLGPAVILNAILTAQIQVAEVGDILVYGSLYTAAMLLTTMTAGRAAGLSGREMCGLGLNAVFPNAVNYGLPVVFFAFGQPGFERAAVFGIYSSVAMATVGLYLALLGGSRNSVGGTVGPTLMGAFRQASQMPMMQAVAIGLIVRALGISLPSALLRPISLVGTGALPILVIILGMQVAGMGTGGHRGRVALGTVLRLVMGPVVALLVARFTGLGDLTTRVMILQAAMPAAVNTTLLAIEFQAQPETVTATTLVTTLLSLITVGALLAIMG